MLISKIGITAINMIQTTTVTGRNASSGWSSLPPPGERWKCPLKSYSPVAMAVVLNNARAGVENAVR